MKMHFIGGPEHGTTKYLESEPPEKYWTLLPGILSVMIKEESPYTLDRKNICQYTKVGEMDGFYLYRFDGVL